MSLYVIDAWPVVEWLLGKQPVAHNFTLFLNACEQEGTRLLITRINRAEILYTLTKRVSEADRARALESFERLALEVISIDDELVDEATVLKAKYACSFADCFAAALAMRLNAPVVTGDKEFLALREAGLLTVEWLGA